MHELLHSLSIKVAGLITSAVAFASVVVPVHSAPAAPVPAPVQAAAQAAAFEAVPEAPAPGAVLGASTGPVSQDELDQRLFALRQDVAVLVSSVLAVTATGDVSPAAAPAALSESQYSAQIDAIHRSIARASNSSGADLAAATGLLGVSQGGTGVSSAPAYGQLLMGDGAGGYALVSTSSLGIASGSSFDLAADHTFTGGNIFASATSTNFFAASATSTRLFATNATSTNLYATSLKAGTLSMSAGLANGAKDLANIVTWFSGSGGAGFNHLAGVSFTRSADTLDYQGDNYGSVVHIDGNWGGAGMTGSRAGLDISMIMQGTTSNTGNGRQYYVGIADYVYCGFNDNGTEGFTNVAGTCNAFNPIAQLGPNATNWYTLNPIEVDVRADEGSSSGHTFGILHSKKGVQGIYDDAAEAFVGTTPWKHIFQLGKTDGGQNVTNASTTILGCVADSYNTGCIGGIGIDLSDNWTWASTSKPFSSPGFSVNGLGGAFASSVTTPSIGAMGGVASLAVGSTGSYSFIPTVNIAAPPSGGSQASAAVATMKLSQWTIGSAGTGYSVNDVLTLAGGTCSTQPQIRVTSVSGGAITGTTGNAGGLCSSPNFGPITLTGGTGSGATLSSARYFVNTFTIISPGNYSVAPAVAIQTSPDGSATATATLGSSSLTLNGGGGSVTIDNNRVAVGTTTGYARLSVWGADAASSTLSFSVVNSASSTVFAVFNGGNAQLSGTLTQSSDKRLKTDIESLDASSTLALIDRLDPVTFAWKDRLKDGPQLGFIAQDVQKLFPALVSTTSPTALTPGGTLGVNYIGFIAPIIKAVQALSSKIDALAAAVAGFADSFTSRQVTTDQLCIKTSVGAPVCVTGDELQQLLSGQGMRGSTPPPVPGTSEAPASGTGDDVPDADAEASADAPADTGTDETPADTPADADADEAPADAGAQAPDETPAAPESEPEPAPVAPAPAAPESA
jgi:hypothetical protein